VRNHRLAHHLTGVATGLAAVAAVTGLVFALRPVSPVLSLGVLYLLAVVPVAVVWGIPYAFAVSVASMLAFNWFFLPPVHTFALRNSENWVALGVYLATGVVVGELAARSRRRAAEAELQAHEAAFVAGAAARLLESGGVQRELREIASELAGLLGAARASIEVDSRRKPDEDETAYDLTVGNRSIGRLYLDSGARVDPARLARLLPTLGSLLAVTADRERLARRAVEAETLRRSDAVKTAILRAVSHDLRSPLTAIRAAAEGLENPSFELGPDDQAALLGTIGLETRRLDRLVSNLLDVSLLESGTAAPRPEVWTLDGLVERALDALGDESARIQVSLPQEPAAVRVDGAQIERVLVNLLENALRVAESVEIAGDETEREALLRVRDDGPGLDERDLERIFDPFERSRSAAGRGSGLGLAIARGFAQANGCRLWAESPPGSGATFVLALPRVEVPAGAIA
jgi:two-component system, OmpR family, sensor histidine kinase KdpD